MNLRGLYKYVTPQQGVIYVGKSERNILCRISDHKREKKFEPFLESAQIYVAVLGNNTEIRILEKLLINKYKPILNKTDKHDESVSINFEEPEWVKLEEVTTDYTVKKMHEWERAYQLQSVEFAREKADKETREKQRIARAIAAEKGKRKSKSQYGVTIYTCLIPDKDAKSLAKTFKEAVEHFYSNPENMQKFEQWKAAREVV